MRILENEQDRRPARDHLDPARQSLHRFLPPLRRGEVQIGIAAVVRHISARSMASSREAADIASNASSLSSLSTRLRVVFSREPGAPGQMADDRVERAVGMLRRAGKAQPRIRLTRQPLQKGRGEPRLADARFAREQDDMPLAFLRLDPGTKQKPNLLFATHERAEPAGVQPIEPARLGALTHHRPGERRPGDALEFLRPEVVEIEQVPAVCG